MSAPAIEGMRRWTVTISRWDTYVVEGVEAVTADQAQDRALDMYEETEDYTHLDGGVNSIEAEPEED